MNIIDAVLCADVIEDAKIDGGLTKVRDKLNSVYGKIKTEGDTPVYDEEFYETLEREASLYDEDFYARLESGELDDTEVSDEIGVELGDEGLPGIPTYG
jgi:hypothetical protein